MGNVLGYPANGCNPHHPSTFDHDNQTHQHCESSARGTGSAMSRSRTSSTTSSSVHLPLAGDYPQQQSYSRRPTSDGVVQDREGFPSAFGLMSLDNSEVLAGLGNAPPSSTTLLRMAAARLLIHLGETILPPMPTHAMPLLCMVRKVPTNSSRRIGNTRETFLLGRRQALRN
jgi:hypothetical protein